MRKIFIPFLASFLIASCEDTDVQVEEIPAAADLSSVLPTKFTKTDSGQTDVTVYTYEGTKLTKEETASTNRSIVYTYNGDLISKADEYSGTSLVLRREFTYEDGKMMIEKITNYQTSTASTTTYEYLSENHVKFTRLGGLYDVYLSNNGNVKVATLVKGAIARTYNNNFDGQNNPYKNIKGYLKINAFLSLEGDLSVNNRTNGNSSQTGTVNGNYTFSTVNTYNDDNFITKMVKTEVKTLSSNTPPNTPVTSTSTYTYEYKK